MRRPALAAGALALVAGLALTACGGDGSARVGSGEPAVRIEDAFIPEPSSGDMAAGFFVVRNSGGADTLTGASSDIAGQVTLHSTEDGRMTEQKSFPVPADGELDFERGARHLMFENVTRLPKQGDKVAVRLRFAEAGTVTVEFPVKAATYDPAAHQSHTSSQ